MGEHVTPTSPSTSWILMPKPSRTVAIAGSLVVPVLSQHSVEAPEPLGLGVATARTATEARKIANLENIFV